MWKQFEVSNVRITFATWPNDAGKIALHNLYGWMQKAMLIPSLTAAWVDADEVTLTFLNAICIVCKYDTLDGRIGKLQSINGV